MNSRGPQPRRIRCEGSRSFSRVIGLLLCLLTSISTTTDVGALAGSDQERAGRPPNEEAGAFIFNDTAYMHRWSENGQHEFTPRGDADLSTWKDMITINVHDTVRDGEALADLANRVVENYKAHGFIMRTLSKPRTDTSEAEHFVAAVLQGTNVVEAAFARMMLVEGRGTVVVYSKRFYGEDAQAGLTRWFKAYAVEIERVLLSWNRIPAFVILDGQNSR